jgi:molecular chaperone HtpG
MVTLPSNAENQADKARQLPGFSNLSLPGLRQEIATMLGLIGRDGIFSTYTRHDISHIDAMLQMLDWLIPAETQSEMTPVDWLMAVLGIYLHDLGMSVTSAEFDGRTSNEYYTAWRKSLPASTEGLEYLARTHRMNEEEKERFFFQEFVRKGHAQRIREWITGQHTRTWGSQVSAIAAKVKDLLEKTPTRFREYLGIVCESHHRSDIDKVDRYPIVGRVGSHKLEVVNVQYAALLLRTADLLHVTRDRTPSVEYEAIKFSDPRSVEEWDKQLGTFAVGPKGREVILSKPETAVVVVAADFTEERPLFALQEYLAYADAEIRQSHRWAEKTQSTEDGKNYHFPWREVAGDVHLEGVPPQPLKFELDRGRLLDLLVGHTIYNDPTVAIRELLQNSLDAVRYQHFLDKKEAQRLSKEVPLIGHINVQWNSSNRLLSITDVGTGMDRDTIVHHLMSVGSSYYNTPQFEADNRDFTPISRFGIGVLTCFMVSDDIEVVTIKARNGHRIRMTSVKSTYLLRELNEGDALLSGIEPHGTRITLRLRDTVAVENRSVEDILRHWIILPECPVMYEQNNEAPKSIGYKSVSEALLAEIHSDKTPIEGYDETASHTMKVIVKKSGEAASPSEGKNSGGMFEMAFAVRKGFFPEWEFVMRGGRPSAGRMPSEKTSAPAVCIEGVRVSDQLPGFIDSSPSALLSVRGVRHFRTTVSRAGLENDEGYGAAAKLCIELLFQHISDEVVRISKGQGNPFSQASSAYSFLVRQLGRGLANNVAVVDELKDKQPQIVIEETVDCKTRRSLISPKELRSRAEFWTLEARAIDSLGMLSRDLGRELSFNEFLVALAPEIDQLRFSPLLPEVHKHRWAVLLSHVPAVVQYSRKHQQTAIQWTPEKKTGDCSLLYPWGGYEDYLDWFFKNLRRHKDMEEGVRLNYHFPYFTACLEGDDPSVQAVKIRVAIIFAPDTPLLEVWQTIRSLLLTGISKRWDFEKVFLVTKLATTFHEFFYTGARSRYVGQPDWNRVWRNAVNDLRGYPDLASIQLPSDLPFTLSKNVFDASRYWLDWDRKDEE